jgi:tRNA pseudouridine13 synthase
MRWMLGRPGPLDRGEVLAAREHFEAGRLKEAADAWPKSFRQQKRVCVALHKSGGDAAKAWSAVDHTLRKLYVSAVQSALFNQVLAERINRLDRLENGDLAWKHANGACFRVLDAAAEQPRCEAFEISPTGPLYGQRMTQPDGAPGEREHRVLADSGLDTARFRSQSGVKLEGARRPLRVPLFSPEVSDGRDERGPFLQLAFGLPPGSYATCVTREVCKAKEEPQLG